MACSVEEQVELAGLSRRQTVTSQASRVARWAVCATRFEHSTCKYIAAVHVQRPVSTLCHTPCLHAHPELAVTVRLRIRLLSEGRWNTSTL